MRVWLFTFCSVHFNMSTWYWLKKPDVRRFITWIQSGDWNPWTITNVRKITCIQTRIISIHKYTACPFYWVWNLLVHYILTIRGDFNVHMNISNKTNVNDRLIGHINTIQKIFRSKWFVPNRPPVEALKMTTNCNIVSSLWQSGVLQATTWCWWNMIKG